MWRLLCGPHDLLLAYEFVAEHPACPMSVWLDGNLQQGGLEFHGKTHQAEYYGYFAEGQKSDSIAGIICLNWKGNLIVQIPSNDVPMLPKNSFKRDIVTAIGSFEHVSKLAISWFNLSESDVKKEILLSLDVGSWGSREFEDTRRAEKADLETLIGCRVAFQLEVFGGEPSKQLLSAASRQYTSNFLRVPFLYWTSQGANPRSAMLLV